MNIWSPEYDPHDRLLFGGGRTQPAIYMCNLNHLLSIQHMEHPVDQEVVIREAHDTHCLLELLLKQVACKSLRFSCQSLMKLIEA